MNDHINESSSSDDENIKEALRESTDQQFLHNSLFNNEKFKTNSTKLESSLRLNSKKNNDIESLGVSQSCKEFVAKKLYEFLERNIEFTEVLNVKNIEKIRIPEGIKLFACSTNTLTGSDESVPDITRSYKRKIAVEDSAENILKCKEVAIDPATIIAKIETMSWSQRQKGTVFKYKKMLDGTLIEHQ